MSFKPNWTKIFGKKNAKSIKKDHPVRKKFDEHEYYKEIKKKIDDLFDKDHDLDDVFANLKERPVIEFDNDGENDIEMEEETYENE